MVNILKWVGTDGVVIKRITYREFGEEEMEMEIKDGLPQGHFTLRPVRTEWCRTVRSRPEPWDKSHLRSSADSFLCSDAPADSYLADALVAFAEEVGVRDAACVKGLSDSVHCNVNSIP